MKKFTVVVVLSAMLVLVGCAQNQGQNASGASNTLGTSESAVQVTSSISSSSSEAASETAGDGKETTIVNIEINGEVLQVTLADNSSVQALVELLADGPITVDMHDYGSFEKVGALPQSLPTNDAQITTSPGDVILYQGNQVTIYYNTNSWSFTRLGHIEGATTESLLAVLGEGDVTATFSLA